MAENSDYVAALNYKIRKVYSRCVDKAQRYALSGLFSASLRSSVVDRLPDEQLEAESPTAEQLDAARRVSSGISGIQDQWRVRLNVLRSCGWHKARKNKDWYYAINCPPVSVATDRNAQRTCRCYRICPFCWSRYYARDLYWAVEWACYGHNRTIWLDAAVRHLKDQQQLFTDILTVFTTWYYPMGQATLEGVLRDIHDEKHGYPLSLDAYGAFVLHVIEPAMDGPTWVWKRTERILALVSPGGTDPPPPVSPTVKLTHTVRRHYGATREHIAVAVGSVCAYPLALMTGPGEAVAQVLDAQQQPVLVVPYRKPAKKPRKADDKGPPPKLQKIALSSYYGALRNREKRKRGQEELRREQFEE